jgi:cell division initiation protein
MDNSSPTSSGSTTSILDTLRTVEFRQQLKGYNVDDVDEYLDRAAQEAEALQEHVRQMTERLRQASDRIVSIERERRTGAAEGEGEAAAAPAAGVEAGLSDETLQRTLLLAQKFVDQTKRESEAEAADIVARAEETARAAVEAAEQAAAKLQAESQEKLREEVARLESRRTELAADVESMARHLDSERNRLRGALSEILKWVDENVQPANSLMGVRPKAAASTRPPGSPDLGSDEDDDNGPPTLLNSTNSAVSAGQRPL